MRYRLYGQDLISKEPQPPLDIDAETEEAARTQGEEMGMEVLQVEPTGPVPPEPAPSQTVPAVPSPGNRPGRDGPRPWSRTGWLLACSVLVLVALTVGIGIGIMVPRVSLIGPGAPSEPGASPAPVGIRLEELKSAEELFDLAGQKAVILKYSGGDVEFWVEIESQGKKEKVGELLGVPGEEEQPGPDQRVEGFLLWVRSDADDAGWERWRMAHRRDLVTSQKSGVQVSNPLAQVSVSQSNETTQSRSRTWSQAVQVWKREASDIVVMFGSEASSISNPLPTDREVCIKEIRRERKQVKSHLAAATASMVGLLSSAPDGPLVATSALASGSLDATLDAHTIKVMCRAASRKAKEGEGEPPAK